jgi:hypothetical protein
VACGDLRDQAVVRLGQLGELPPGPPGEERLVAGRSQVVRPDPGDREAIDY